ncbi:MAG: hypothetical protein JO089_08440, partial [Alphaproteobacteria bacterium]|nr:hypothetical protein [Alphaproteobacteria bacterium]
VDNKYMETFSTAFLTSLISIGIAVGADSVVKGPNTTTVNVNGSTTTGSAGAAAAGQAVTTFGQVAQDVVNSMLDLRPTITVDQGTRINVFVNRDLMFPEDGPGAVFIQ